MKFTDLQKHIENPIRQHVPFGCGLHCFAILFNEPKFLDYLTPEVWGDRFKGMGIDDENDILEMVRPDDTILMRLSPVFFSHHTSETGVNIELIAEHLETTKKNLEEIMAVPFWFGIKRTPDSMFHRILIITTREGHVMIDPKKIWMYKSERSMDFLEEIFQVQEVSRMVTRQTDRDTMNWSYCGFLMSNFQHLNLKNIFSPNPKQ